MFGSHETNWSIGEQVGQGCSYFSRTGQREVFPSMRILQSKSLMWEGRGGKVPGDLPKAKLVWSGSWGGWHPSWLEDHLGSLPGSMGINGTVESCGASRVSAVVVSSYQLGGDVANNIIQRKCIVRLKCVSALLLIAVRFSVFECSCAKKRFGSKHLFAFGIRKKIWPLVARPGFWPSPKKTIKMQMALKHT